MWTLKRLKNELLVLCVLLMVLCVAVPNSQDPKLSMTTEEITRHAKYSELVICDPEINHKLVVKMMERRLPFVQIFAYSDHNYRSNASICNAMQACNGCRFVLIQTVEDNTSRDQRIFPFHSREAGLYNDVYRMLGAVITFHSHIETDANVFTFGDTRVEHWRSELPALGSIKVTAVLGDILVVRTVDGVELLRYSVNTREDDVYVMKDADVCDRTNIVTDGYVCMRPLNISPGEDMQFHDVSERLEDAWDEANAPKGVVNVMSFPAERAEDLHEPVHKGALAPLDTTVVPMYVLTAKNRALLDDRIRDWRERQDTKKQQYILGTRFTERGYKVIPLQPGAWEALRASYSSMQTERYSEKWAPKSTLMNHWDSLPRTVLVGDAVKSLVSYVVKREFEEWIGEPVKFVSVTDVRRYLNGSIIGYHVDDERRHGLAAIINVDQDVDEPWPFQVFSHDDTMNEVYLEPGQMLLLESSTCVHGRVQELRGEQYSNLFAYFKSKW